MSVERRYNKRYPMTGEVYIRYRKQQVFPANAVNCSMQGIFLHTRSLTMLTGAMVELTFFYAGRHWTVTGIVTHSQRDGVGIMFWRPQPQLYDAVIASVSGNQPIAHQDGTASEAAI
ncbi:MAG: PilZ domain-containing protein [Candidatus Thiodiazotropha sp. (ex Lucina aurantia)]|uniref:PilZ domain protein n=2 Tax=Candidatus Thiodiazotropha TaxID=1913444 RepID=A0A7Z0VL74_9GAMM|nr:PilZ domain-containing protein [Candidatus Thiodiazotropha endolucinida]MBT3013016.1 PilZ domain-containing protein [Candidatus Thiodiazotropha sp. (ex Lucina pensylvanica)]MBT3017028.1 PilZ domain-containing protein [Candidatus Thiodiazotropha taylori]MBT3037390.1 PilZ domain-containing protein [Candidatus Thiodiazotropha sp. (ex Codakia orbicularis)]MBV2101816.1 PilZ domain-containing protein [Candidatus Thiodiazotropha sp. (ex Lucina aurantia)]MBT3024036.1 PilZ domain-containing protein 